MSDVAEMAATASDMPEGWERVRVADALVRKRGEAVRKLQTSEYGYAGALPIVDQGAKFICGYTDDLGAAFPHDLPVIVFGDHTRALKYVDFPFAVGADGTQCLHPSDDFDSRYFFYALGSVDLRSEGYARHFKLLKEQLIARPPLAEQRRIAEVLRSVDEAIAAQRATCNQHTQLIDAVFEAWSNQSAPMVALVDLLDLKNGINFEKEERADEGTLTLDVMNMFSNDMTPTYERAYRISKAVPSDLILQSGDVLFVRSSVKREGVGWTSLADGFDEMTTFCGFIIRGRPKRDDVLSRYVVGVLRAPKYRRWLIQHSTRSALTNINQKTISSAVIPLPSFEHQQGLVEQYDRLAAAAFDCKTALATLEALRTKLTGDLLSGRVRVPA